MKNKQQPPQDQELFEALQNVADFTALQSDMAEIKAAVYRDKVKAPKVTVLDIIIRIIALPFYSGLSLIWLFNLWIKTCYNFISFGGEAIAYNNQLNRKSLTDVFFQLKKQQNDKPTV